MTRPTHPSQPSEASGIPDVVLQHGWLMGPDLWDTQVGALAGVARFHALAAPAHGTAGPPGGFTMGAWADMVVDELDRRGVEQAVFVGHSMSGWLVQQLWRDHPERVLGLGLIGITARAATPDEAEQFKGLGRRVGSQWRQIAPTLAELLVGRGYLSSHPGWVDRWIDHVERHHDLAGMAALNAAIAERPDYTPTTSQIDVPTVVVHGTADRAIPIDLGRQLAALIPGAGLVEIDDAGHALPLERPTAVTTAISKLLHRVTTPNLPGRSGRSPTNAGSLGRTASPPTPTPADGPERAPRERLSHPA